MRRSAAATTALCCALAMNTIAPPRAQALNPINTACGIGGLVSGVIGKACNVGGKLLGAGKKVFGGGGGPSGAGASTATGGSGAQAAIGLAAIGAWVLVGAKVALHETAKVIARTTSPRLTTTWFSSTYWRMAGIGAILTLPFLFAAAIQALIRSDLALLLRAAFGYLPLALLAVGVAAPVTMLLLAATDEMCAVVSSAAGNAGVRFLGHVGALAGTLSIVAGSPFLALLTGLVAAFGALVLWIELLMREAAVYVIVLMLPLAFSAFVWPARRVWAIRAVELLVALILSKFAIVAVLTLGGAALGQSPSSGVTGMLAGGVLVILGALAPWALVRLLPLAELAAGAAGALRHEVWRSGRTWALADELAQGASAKIAASAGAGSDPDEPHVMDEAHAGARAETERLAELSSVPVGVAAGAPGHRNGAGEEDAGEVGVEPAPAGLGIADSDPGWASPGGPSGGAPGAGASQGAGEAPGGGAGQGAGGAPGDDPSPSLRPFQMDDYTWRLSLDPADGWPPPPVFPDDDPAGAERGGRGGHGDGDRPTDRGGPADGNGTNGDPDPLPPPEKPEGGHL